MVNVSAFEHKSFDNYCYPLDKDRLEINLKTAKDVSSVFLCWGDPFDRTKEDSWIYNELEVQSKKELQHHFWWTATVEPPSKRCKYFFKIQGSDGSSYVYGESGVYTEDEYKKSPEDFYDFIFPWMNESDICATPSWAENAVWYQIFPARFARGKNQDMDGIKAWAAPGDKVKNEDRYGGSLAGITEKLPYLSSLGITGLYLNPINASSSQHKYDTADYYKIDREFGTEEDLKTLVKTAHAHGIKVMLDGVFNHSGWDFFAWQDVLKNREKSEYASWYMVNDWNFEAKPHHNAHNRAYYSFAYSDNMPKFNTNNSEVREYLLKVCEFWVKEYDIDALRLDVANEVCHLFCKELRSRMRELKSDFYIIGEIWHNSLPWLRGDEFDGIMNYPLQNAIYSFSLNPSFTAKDFECSVNRCLTDYPSQIRRAMFNLMDSHDTMRLVTRLGSKEKALQVLALMLFMPGSPCLYYGTEVFLEGGRDPDCRRCMPWKEIQEGIYDSDIEKVKKLISLRKEKPLMKEEDIDFSLNEAYANVLKNNRVLFMQKKDRTSSLLFISNFSTSSIDIKDFLGGSVVFENLLKESSLLPNGIIIIGHL